MTDNYLNQFYLFGNFDCFKEEAISMFSKIFENCDFSIIQDPNKQENPTGKTIRILDKANGMNIIIRDNRINVDLSALIKNGEIELFLPKVIDQFKAIFLVLGNPFITRVSLVSSVFVDKDSLDLHNELINAIPLLHKEKASECTIRYNEPTTICGEKVNFVTGLNIGHKSNNQGSEEDGLIMVYDLNTLFDNKEQRFDVNDLDHLYKEFYSYIYEHIKFIG